MLAPAAGPVSLPDLNIDITELLKEQTGNASELLNDLYAPDLIRKLRQNRRLVPQPSSHLEHLLVRMW
jgi:hypothetical protein